MEAILLGFAVATIYFALEKNKVFEKWDNWVARPFGWNTCSLCICFHISYLVYIPLKLIESNPVSASDIIVVLASTSVALIITRLW